MQSKSSLLIAGAAAIGMTMPTLGCSEVRQAPTGTAVGAGAGAIAGAALSDSAIGAVLGGLIGGAVGNVVGRNIERGDRSKMERAFETGRPTTIRHRDEGVTLHVVPLERLDYYRGYDGPCREFLLEAETPAGYDEGYGVACRTGDDWRIVSGPGEIARRPR